ncbi:MAG: hypothetical protein ABW148_09750 [Sedimenticola sp.]
MTLFSRETHILRPWIFGASVWLALSLVVSLEYLRAGRSDHLYDLIVMMSLLWMQFGFAGLFHTLRRERGRNAALLILVTLLPPAMLFLGNFFLAWWMGTSLPGF